MPIDDALLLPGIRWVIAYVGGWKPREVIDYLVRVGYHPYCPLTHHIQPTARRCGPHGGRGPKRVSSPLFGGYLFVGEARRPSGHVMPLSRDTHYRIFDILGDSTGPKYVEPEALLALRRRELAGEWDYSRRLDERYPAGKKITVKTGHFAAFEAMVIRVEASGKILARFNFFGSSRDAEVDPKNIAA